ncbi:hypothetical protein A3D78_06035 [Candidatus Gottesmanbacteria bacterium RIFCSPHIGHO2_02_FULL_39_14]|uniref:Uncharacterized protein n=3 Tax=Candidatus Gottesmaniibacteriota TaxID=1752720 RepID=A0A1F5ZZ19_9BACT|nr:MAG: hypothetical protein A2153_05225 [Candidatus Gottesmanbacteria bacterium RBG_16_38_7b]OGG17412.1 MAG: hypothetical protein A3D78_06035 [Candidatus Gottesmanbacteria bacterium RIFCSPHIGHO2_02_FULL_39_14]OGG31603.1 MAG: hypothetical protein A3I51_04085 [Candidatus Gottesmanbacteria bacterium RIFCSPLOWO2_02_FULL_38_8]
MNRKEVYILAIITFLTVFAWVVFGIIHAKNTSAINASEIKKLAPLTPYFDSDIINQLNTRRDI